jgi:hypothetical protein
LQFLLEDSLFRKKLHSDANSSLKEVKLALQKKLSAMFFEENYLNGSLQIKRGFRKLFADAEQI